MFFSLPPTTLGLAKLCVTALATEAGKYATGKIQSMFGAQSPQGAEPSASPSAENIKNDGSQSKFFMADPDKNGKEEKSKGQLAQRASATQVIVDSNQRSHLPFSHALNLAASQDKSLLLMNVDTIKDKKEKLKLTNGSDIIYSSCCLDELVKLTDYSRLQPEVKILLELFPKILNADYETLGQTMAKVGKLATIVKENTEAITTLSTYIDDVVINNGFLKMLLVVLTAYAKRNFVLIQKYLNMWGVGAAIKATDIGKRIGEFAGMLKKIENKLNLIGVNTKETDFDDMHEFSRFVQEQLKELIPKDALPKII